MPKRNGEVLKKSYKSLHAKKSLGQNFLTDEWWIHRIIQAFDIKQDDYVLEIGPGKGVLTRHLVKQTGHLTAVEIDSRMVGYLQEEFAGQKNLDIVHEDFLKYDLSRNFGGQRLRIIGNLPYHVTTGILLQVLDEVRLAKSQINEAAIIDDFSIMIQKEVADRITCTTGNKKYGILSVFVDTLCDSSIVLDVPPEAFSPRPKIMSSVIRLKPLKTPRYEVKDWDTFRLVVRSAFGKRRKMLRNSLDNIPGIPTIEELEKAAPEFLELRPEQINPASFVDLANKCFDLSGESND
jgi:16S rRNA (adenine1518-N6/adenine1519-N6)-dimethyltransferase